MASQAPVKVDKKELERAETLWVNFGVVSKWTIIFVAVVLIGMGITLL